MKKMFRVVLALVLAVVALVSPTASAQEELTMVWYPNESGADLQESRDQIGKLIEEATGKKVKHLTTTDYNIAIEAISSGQGNFAFMGAQGYVQAHELNAKVEPLVVISGKSGTLEDAVYYSWINVPFDKAEEYKNAEGKYSLENIKGKKMSFVSESSTSGFKIAVKTIMEAFKDMDLKEDDFLTGGADKFFSEVMFGGSHQGSLFNVISGKADVAAACDTCVFNYVEAVEGEFNQPGTVYAIRKDAEQPFNNNVGDKFVAISVAPVLNSPFAVNRETTSDEDYKKVQELFTSDDFRNKVFISKEDKEAGKKGLFYQEENNKFVVADDSFFQPIRELN